MLIYVASYPRCGSALMEQTINTFFEHPLSPGYPINKPIESFFATAPYAVNWRYNPQILSPNKTPLQVFWQKLNSRTLKKYDLNQWIGLYDLKEPPYTKNCRCLLPGCLKALTPENRKKLANEETCFFVKTHELPYPKYFDNEYVIQMIRHPGNVFWSYFNLLKNFNNQSKTLDEIIRGETPFGAWSQWYQRWNSTIPSLSQRFLRLRFEDVVAEDRRKTCDRIKELVSLDYKPENQEPSFEELQERSPKYYQSGKIDNWQKHYTSEQIQLIQALHGDTMQQFGYER